MRLTALIFLVIILAGCRQEAADDFLLFEEDYFSALLAFQPTLGTLSGIHQYDESLEDYNRGRIEARAEELRSQAARLAALREQPLRPNEAIDAEVLQSRIEAELFEMIEEKAWETNPMLYVGKPGEAVDALLKRDFAPGRERIPAVIARMQAVPRLVDAMKANVRHPPVEFTELALRMAQGSIAFFKDTVPRWAAPFATVDERGRVEKAALLAQLAMEDAARWIERDLKPRSNGRFALGEQRFLKKLRLEEMIALPLKQLLATGEAALARDQKRFRKLAQGASVVEAMNRLSGDHPREAELLAATRTTLERTRKFLVDKQLISLPNDLRPTVTETPPYARNGAFASMDSPGAYETRATEAYYYITPPEREWSERHKEQHLRLFNRPVLEMITIHEAFPGHFTHFLHAERFPTKTRKLISTGSTVEGWAHYAEQMMIEQGYGAGDPRLELAQLSEALLRDCRFVAGIKMHTEGWSVERAAKFFVDQGGQEPANAREEAMRGTYNPTYLYYTMGKLMVYQLRKDFEREHSGELHFEIVSRRIRPPGRHSRGHDPEDHAGPAGGDTMNPITESPIALATMALLDTFEQECPREHFPQAMFAAYQADDFTSAMEEGISFYLFRVDLAPDQRQGRTLYLSYLMTAWSPDPLRQQQILNWALRVVWKNGALGHNSRLEVQSLPISDLAAVWSMARVSAQPSVALMVRVFD